MKRQELPPQVAGLARAARLGGVGPHENPVGLIRVTYYFYIA